MTTELMERQDTAPASVNNSTSFLMVAMEKGYDLDQIERLMDIQDRHDAAQAKKAFVAAMAKFKSIPIKIPKDTQNGKYGSWYTTIGVLVNTVLPAMSQCGLSHRWDTEQPSMQEVRVTCTVTHEMGHSESTTMMAPPDKSGSKNPIQEIKSTRTYLQSATFESIMGLASTNANINDDGNGATQGKPVEYITDAQVGQLLDMAAAIAEIEPERNAEKGLIKYLKVSSVDLIPANRFSQALSVLTAVLSDAKKKQEVAA